MQGGALKKNEGVGGLQRKKEKRPEGSDERVVIKKTKGNQKEGNKKKYGRAPSHEGKLWQHKTLNGRKGQEKPACGEEKIRTFTGNPQPLEHVRGTGKRRRIGLW